MKSVTLFKLSNIQLVKKYHRDMASIITSYDSATEHTSALTYFEEMDK